jgi:hypothetical protein
MLIIFGTRVTKKPLGHVAEYCRFCHAIQPCMVTAIRSHTHLYYIPISRQTVQGHLVECVECRRMLGTGVSSYAGFEAKRLDVETLIETTNPKVEQAMLEQLELEERVASGTGTPADRYRLLLQPFLDIAPEFEARCAQVHVDWRSGMLIALWIVLPWWLVIAGIGSSSAMLYSGLALAGVLGVAVLWSLATDPRRFLERRHRRFIGESLVEIEPTVEELTQVLASLRGQGLKLGKRVKPAWVLDAIREVRGTFTA